MKKMTEILILSLSLILTSVPITLANGDPNVIATIDINPNTINTKSKGNWINCDIWLPEGNDVGDIVPESIVFEGEVEADTVVIDVINQVVTVQFDRSAVQELLIDRGMFGDEVEVIVSGELVDANTFAGTEIIKVLGEAPPAFAITKLSAKTGSTTGEDSIKIQGTIDTIPRCLTEESVFSFETLVQPCTMRCH